MQEPPFARDLSPNTLRQAVADVPGSLGIETKPTFLPLRVQYQSEKLQLGFGMHSLALPSGPHVPMSQFPAPGFGLSQFVTYHQTSKFFRAGYQLLLQRPGLALGSLGLVDSVGGAGVTSTLWPAPRSMFSYLLDPGTIAKAAREWHGMAALPLV
jgi:hypothetical protein